MKTRTHIIYAIVTIVILVSNYYSIKSNQNTLNTLKELTKTYKEILIAIESYPETSGEIDYSAIDTSDLYEYEGDDTAINLKRKAIFNSLGNE